VERSAVDADGHDEVRKRSVLVLRDAQAYKHGKRGKQMKVKALVGSGDKIGLFTLPFLLLGVILNKKKPSFFRVGGPPTFLQVIALLLLLPGLTIWMWSVLLILTNVPQNKLIINGPYAFVKHPLYTHGLHNEMYLRIKWLHRPVCYSRFFLAKDQKYPCFMKTEER
jgi:protein-S-isoprenylcysteine O-methyltransferase Ste14